jgi:hypothetical protein
MGTGDILIQCEHRDPKKQLARLWNPLVALHRPRVQLRYMQIFEYDPFPEHVNQLLSAGMEDFVAIRIGPLNYSDDYVHKSETPDPKLSGELLFLAKRMGLRGPPLDVAHPKEMQIFNNFTRQHPGKPSTKRLQELVKLFKSKADNATGFLKLPSQLSRHYQKWKVSQEVVLVKYVMQDGCYELLRKLASTLREVPGDAETFQRAAVQKEREATKQPRAGTRTQRHPKTSEAWHPANPLPGIVALRLAAPGFCEQVWR